MFIGLDLSLTETGFAAINDDTITAQVIKPPASRVGMYRLDYLEKRIMKAVLEHDNIQGIAVEGYAMAGKGRVFDIGELGGVIKLSLRRAKLPAVIVPPKTLKQFAAGNGNADKDRMVYMVSRLWHPVTNHNEADAIALAKFAERYFTGAGGVTEFTKLQKKCVRIPIN